MGDQPEHRTPCKRIVAADDIAPTVLTHLGLPANEMDGIALQMTPG